MVTRKIQLTGGSTYTVSLPKEWATDHDIEPGTEVHLHPHMDGSLVLRARHDENGKLAGARVAVDDLDDSDLGRTIRSLYTAGFDSIAVIGGEAVEKTHRRTLRSIANQLIGIEIVEESADRVVLESLLNPVDVSIRQTVVQLQYTALSMHRNATALVTDSETEVTPGQVVERDTEADRLFAMVARHFNRSLSDLGEIDELGVERPTLFDYHTTARQLERVADHAERIALVAGRLDAGPSSTVAEEMEAAGEEARRVVETAANALLGESGANRAYEALDRRDAVTDELARLDRVIHEDATVETYPLTHAVDSLVRTAEYGGNVAERAIQAAARDQEF